MVDIEAGYFFYGREPYQELHIHKVMTDGTFAAELIDLDKTATVVHGSYDAATNKVQFSVGGSPGETLFTKFFKGFVILERYGVHTAAIAGTWSEQRLSFGPARTFNGVVYDNGGWFAQVHSSP